MDSSAPFKHEAYVAYMLRFWQAGSRDGTPVWRASLENPHTGERLAFGDVNALFDFLNDFMASVTAAQGAPETSEHTGAEKERAAP